MSIRKIVTCIYSLLFICCLNTKGQTILLKPGFNKAEYTELLKIAARQSDAPEVASIPAPEYFARIYRSATSGLDNRWELWTSSNGIAVISIRGTTSHDASWLENFYAAMVPAAGSIKLANDFTFNYHLADHPRAAVHAGWLIGTAFLSKDILPKIDSLYAKGTKQFIILGHSQGGTISFLLTAYLENQKSTKRLPSDIRFKTYSSAAPKPGNLYFAYDYERLTMGGWGLTVVNQADWVPETPVSIQTLDDFNAVNPFSNISPLIKKQKFPKNLFIRHVYNQLNKSPIRARKKYELYLGKTAGGLAKKYLPGYEPPKYIPSMNYARCGQYIVLQADAAYYRQYPDNPQKVFIHHGILPYLYLTSRLPE